MCYKEVTRRKLGRILAIVLEDNIRKLKIQRVLTFNELPKNLRNKTRQQQFNNGALWLLDRNEHDAVILLDPQDVVQSITIGQSDNSNGRIVEILYKHNNYWKLRLASLDYKHPSEYITIKSIQNNDLPIYKLFLDIYYD